MKYKILSALAVATSLGAASPASAAVVLFQGTATGCFGTACTPGSYVAPPGAGSSVVDGGLTYVNGAFNQSTDPFGLLGLGGSQDNLGRFNLTATADSYYGDVFRLLVTFALPTGAGSTLFQTVLQGSVTSTGVGSVVIDFDNTPILFNSTAGQFTFAIADVNISAPGENQILGGTIHMLPVPEPATWAMMLLGFGGIGMAMRRRQRPALAQIA